MTNLWMILSAFLMTNSPAPGAFTALSTVSIHTNASVEFWPAGPNPMRMTRMEIVYVRIVTPVVSEGTSFTNINYLTTNIIPHVWRPEPRRQKREEEATRNFPSFPDGPPSPPGATNNFKP